MELRITRDMRIPTGKFGNVNSSITIGFDDVPEEEFTRKFLLAEKWLDYAQALEVDALLGEGLIAAEDSTAYHDLLSKTIKSDDFKAKLKLVGEKLATKKE